MFELPAAFQTPYLALALVVVVSGCTKKDEAPSKSAPSAVTTPVTPAAAGSGGDGKSQGAARTVALGKPVTGTYPCPGPIWFKLVPGSHDGSAHMELRVPKDAPQVCMHLDAHDSAGKLIDTSIAICSDDPNQAASSNAPFSKEAAYFALKVDSDPKSCSAASYKLWIEK